MSASVFQYVPWQTNLLEKAGYTLSKEAVLLDFGCGAGECVAQFRQAGYEIYGCDVAFPTPPNERLRSFMANGLIKQINQSGQSGHAPYTIPFPDNTFDLVFSGQVFEHVMDYPAALAEIARVLKPGGFSVHVFPGRWRLKEAHTNVPLAGVFRGYWWLKLWAYLGVRNEHQSTLSVEAIARDNRRYLTQETNYPTKKTLRRLVRRHFQECRFAEEAYVWISPKLGALIRLFPFLYQWYLIYFSETDMRVLVFGNKLPRG